MRALVITTITLVAVTASCAFGSYRSTGAPGCFTTWACQQMMDEVCRNKHEGTTWSEAEGQCFTPDAGAACVGQHVELAVDLSGCNWVGPDDAGVWRCGH